MSTIPSSIPLVTHLITCRTHPIQVIPFEVPRPLHSNAITEATPLHEYQNLLESGVLRGDDHQTRIIQQLQDLHDKLVDYNPPKIPDIVRSNSLVCTRPLAPFLDINIPLTFSSLEYSPRIYLSPHHHPKVRQKGFTCTAMLGPERQC